MIYLDYNATTPLDPEVLEAMLPYMKKKYGNASSTTHLFGKIASRAVDRARKLFVKAINATYSKEIVFTSGATESINTAIIGTVLANNTKKYKILTTAIEHKAVLDTCKYVERFGVKTEYITVDHNGIVDVNSLKRKLDNEVVLVVIQHVNNEIGTIQPIAEIGNICDNWETPLLVDAAQSLGKIPIDVCNWKITFLAGSSHKVYGPKGIGLLYKNSYSRFDFVPLIHGGGHQYGLRSGTLNVPGIVGFGKAIEIAIREMKDESYELIKIGNMFLKSLENEEIDYFINGSSKQRIHGNFNFCFPGVDADWIILNTPEIAISTGSACTSESLTPSHVLRFLGLNDEEINQSLRISFGRFTTKEEIIKSAHFISNSVKSFLDRKLEVIT